MNNYFSSTFYFLYTLAKTFKVMLNRSRESEHPCIFADFQKKLLRFPFEYNVCQILLKVYDTFSLSS